jgi:hypothetical protein
LSTIEDCLPEGWQLQSRPQHLDMTTLVGRQFVFYWNDYGWAIGRFIIRRIYQGLKGGRYNCEAQYVGGERYDQFMDPKKYFNGDVGTTVPASWALLQPVGI